MGSSKRFRLKDGVVLTLMGVASVLCGLAFEPAIGQSAFRPVRGSGRYCSRTGLLARWTVAVA